MDAHKLLMILCCFVLIICLTLCISSLTVLRNAVSESRAAQSEAAALAGSLDMLVESLNSAPETESSVSVSTEPEEAPKTEGFLLRNADGKLGVFTAEGDLLGHLEVPVDHLPAADRAALDAGISAPTLSDLLALIRDYSD